MIAVLSLQQNWQLQIFPVYLPNHYLQTCISVVVLNRIVHFLPKMNLHWHIITTQSPKFHLEFTLVHSWVWTKIWMILSTIMIIVLFFSFIFTSWRLITLQYCSGFCHTLTWISHGFTCIPHPDPPSHLPLQSVFIGLSILCSLSVHLSHPPTLVATDLLLSP